MDRETAAYFMLISISAIVLLTLVLWSIEKVRHRRAVWDAHRRTLRPDWSPEDEPIDDDPYGVGMNDKDIL